MTLVGVAQIVLFLLVLLVLVKPLGWYMAQIYEAKPAGLNQVGKPFEFFLYRLCSIKPKQGMDWKQYLSSMLLFNLFGLLLVYVIARLQAYLPLNPGHFASRTPAEAINTAISFTTNTNWQSYSGEMSMAYFTQMLALTTQNFLSAASGMSLLVAFIRGIARHEGKSLGNFWVDTVRGVLYILLPLSLLLALALVSQGVIQNIKPNVTIGLVQAGLDRKEQVIPMGPVASQEAIKQLGTNGGGFFNTNSAHPFENPTPLSNMLEWLAMALIPASLCYTFGRLVRDKRQGWALLAAMYLIFIPSILFAVFVEQGGNPLITALGVDNTPTYNTYPGGNMEGKETRFGIVSSASWSITATATATGAVNSNLDSYTPLGGLIPLWMMQLGEVVFGGVGAGLNGFLILVIITVFLAGLMVGRTPEYLGKKIEPFEMKMASVAVLMMPLIVLLSTAVATLTSMGAGASSNSGPHGFTEIFYAMTSMGNNNGSAFAGLDANRDFYNLVGGLVMLLGRYGVAIPVLAIAGALVRKKSIPTSVGTLATHTPLFVVLLIGVTLILGALSFFPALALGPIAEQLMLWGQNGH